MSTAIIDERIVEMRFNNADFEKNVAQSLSTLEKLKSALNFDSAKSLNELSKASNGVNMNGLSSAVETVQAKFSALQVVGMTALSEITKAAINAGTSMLKSLISPITEGGMKRALNIEQAKFQLEGLGVAWKDVGDDINYAVDGTAYGLDVAARAAAQLSASNVQTGDSMKKALRGISGVAAMTGREYEDISRIFTTVAGNGRVMASELNRIGERGLNAKAAIADFFNSVNDGSVEASANVEAAIKSMTNGITVSESDISEFVKKGLVNFDIFAEAMDSAFGEHAKDANKTFTGALSNMKAALSRIGADFAGPYMESMKNIFNAARVVFNGIRTALKPVVADYEYFIKIIEKGVLSILENKSFNNGLVNIIETVRQAFWNLLLVLDPIRQAFNEVFPIDLLASFESFTKKLQILMRQLEISNGDAANLKDTFKGIFSIFKAVGTVVASVLQAIVTALFPATQTMGGFLSTVLSVTGALGRYITEITQVILKSEILQGIIKGIGNVLATVIKIASVPILLVLKGIVSLIGFVENLIVAFKKYNEETGLITKATEIFYNVLNTLGNVLFSVAGIILTGIVVAVSSLITGITNLVAKIKDFVANSEILQRILTGIKNLGSAFLGFVNDLLNKLKQSDNPWFEKLGNSMESAFKQMENGTTILEKLSAGFQIAGNVIVIFAATVAGVLYTAGKAVVDFVKKVIDKFNELGGKTDSITETIGRAFKAIGTTISDFVKNTGILDFLKKFKDDSKDSIGVIDKLKQGLHDFFSEFTIGHAIALAFVGLMTAVGLSFIDLSKKIGGAVSNIGGLIGDIRNKLFGKKKNSMIDNFKELAISIALVAGSLALLASVDQGNLKSAVGLIAAIVGGLTVLTGIMTAVSILLQKKGLTTNMQQYARTMLEMSIAVGILAAALYGLQSVNIDGDNLIKMLEKIGIVLGTMLGLAGIITILSKAAPGFTKGSISIVAAAVALMLVAETLKGLKGIDIDDISDGLIAAGGMFVALGVVMRLGSSFNLSAGAGLLLACIGIKKLLPVLITTMQALAEADLSGLKSKIENNKAMIIAGVAALSIVLLALGKAAPAFQAVGKILLSMAILSVAIAASTAILSAVFKDLTKFFEGLSEDSDAWKRAAVAMGVMVGVLGAFAILFAAFAKLKIENAVSKLLSFSVFLVAFSGCLLILTQVMKQVANLEWGQIAKGGVVIAGLAVIIDAMMYFAGKADKVNTKSLVALMISLTVLMGELIVLSVIPYEKLLAATVAMAGVMWGFAQVVNSISEIKMTKDLIAQILIMAEVTAAMVLIGKTISHLAQFDWESIAAAGGAMLAAMIGVKLVLDSLDGLKVDVTAIAALGVIAIDLISIGASLYLVSQQDWESIAVAGGAILVAMLGIVAVLKVLDGISVNTGALIALGIASVDLIAVGTSLYFVSQNDWESIAAAGGAIFAAMTSIAIVLKVIDGINVNVGAIVALGVGAAAMLAVGFALSLVADQPWEQIAAAGIVMSVALLAVAGALALVTTIGGLEAVAAAAAIVAVSASLVILAAALKMFEDIDPEALKQAGIAFGVLVGVLAVMAGISALTGGLFGVALLGVAAAMLVVGAAAIAFGAGVTLAAVGMNLMIPPLTTMQSMDMGAIALGLGELALGLIAIGGAGTVVALGGAGMLIASAGIAALGLALGVANPQMEKFQKLDFATVAKTSGELAKSGVELIGGAIGFTAAGAALLVFSVGLTSATGTLAVFNTTLAMFLATLNMAAPTAQQAATNITNGIKKPFEDLIGKIKKFGEDFKAALTSGLSGAEKEASSGGNKIAKALINPFRTVLGWHSPPQFIIDLFSDMATAIISGGNKAEGTAATTGTGIANSLKSSILGGLSGFSIDGILAQMFGNLNFQIGLTTTTTKKYVSIKDQYKAKTEAATKAAKEDARAEKDFEKAAKEATVATEEQTIALEGLAKSAGGAGGAVKQTANDLTSSLTETISGQLDMFKQFELKTEITAEQMLNNMRSNLEGFKTWSTELAGLAERGIDQSLYQKLAEMGPNCYETVHAFSMMTDDQLQQANQMWQESITLPETAAQKVGAGFDLAGKNAVNGLTGALKAGISDVTSSGEQVGAAAVNGVMDENGLAERSPSRKTYQAGRYAIEGLNNGMKSMTAYVKGTATAIARFIVDDFEVGLAPNYFTAMANNAIQALINQMNAMSGSVYSAAYEVGKQAMAGLEQGLNDYQGGPLAKAEEIASKITEKISKALEVKSPSRVMMRIGKYVSEGLAIGIDKGAGKVYTSAEKLADVTEDGAKSMEGRIQDFLTDNLDFDPVITPVLDLSYMRQQLSSVNALFGDRSLAASYVGQNGGISSGANTQIDYTQNIYSPKALNRYEIYRDTQNLVSQLRGALG